MAATTKTKAAERFANLQKRDQAVRHDIEAAARLRSEKVAKLRELRLAKEAEDAEAKKKEMAEKEKMQAPRKSRSRAADGSRWITLLPEPALGCGVVGVARSHPVALFPVFLALPEGRRRLEVVHQKLGGFESGAPMLG